MIRNIFTVVDGATKSRKYLAALSDMIQRSDLHLHVEVLTPAPMISKRLAPFGSLREPGFALEADAISAEFAVRALFTYESEQVCVEGTYDDVFFLPGALKRVHALADLNIIGALASWEVPWLRNHVVEALIFNSGTPVLLMPTKPVLRDFDHIVIGWKPTAETIRALHDVVSITNKGAMVEVVTISSTKITGDEYDDEIVNYLERHGFEVERRWLEARGDDAKQLQDYAVRRKATLLAVGAFGHSRFRELILGGVTRSFVSEVRIPTLLSR